MIILLEIYCNSISNWLLIGTQEIKPPPAYCAKDYALLRNVKLVHNIKIKVSYRGVHYQRYNADSYSK